ncbi:MAG: hypothetical protein RL653_2492 [Pseudomonadota bacterium]|jgi:uncharacterized protein (TIGR02265 family)
MHAATAPSYPLAAPFVPRVSPELLSGLFQNALSRRLTPRLLERLAEDGLRVDDAPTPAPHARFGRWLQVTAESLYCGMDFPAAYHALGRETARALGRTPAGWVLSALGPLTGPARALERSARLLGGAGGGWTGRAERLRGRGRCLRVLLEPVELPDAYVEGFLGETAQRAGARGARCQGLKGPGALHTWEVCWRD